jgi:hypothetical protein
MEETEAYVNVIFIFNELNSFLQMTNHAPNFGGQEIF